MTGHETSTAVAEPPPSGRPPAPPATGEAPPPSDPPFPCFNLAAFLVPPVWGPAHGQWAGAVFLPMWLFADSIVASAVERGLFMRAGAALVVIVTLTLQAWFGRNANPLAWRRVADSMTPEQFIRRERIWAFASVPLALLLLGWASYYQLVLAG